MMEEASQQDTYLKLDSSEEVRLLLRGLEALEEKNVVVSKLQKRLAMASRYFRSLNKYDIIRAAARKRDKKRRQDGRG